MKIFRIDRDITSSDGTQSFACKAENAGEAEAVFRSGGGILIDHEHTAEGLAPVECCEVYETDESITPYTGSIKSIKVKPLVWSDNDYAHTPFGIIRAANQPFKSPDRYDVDSDFGIDLYGFNSLEAAKQTAQEQYEKLILECLA